MQTQHACKKDTNQTHDASSVLYEKKRKNQFECNIRNFRQNGIIAFEDLVCIIIFQTQQHLVVFSDHAISEKRLDVACTKPYNITMLRMYKLNRKQKFKIMLQKHDSA